MKNSSNAWFMDEVAHEEPTNTIKDTFPNVTHGKLIHIAHTAYLDHRAPIILGDKVTICDWCKLLTHDYSPVHVKGEPERVAGITIGSNVFIGIQAIILPGVTIGDNVIVGAGAVVSKDLPSNGVYAGNPAIKVKDIILQK